ncbi:hypothetical protein K1719_036369 [Acacia pycnantha]|nr:hypothetical protein K1719_036369 [Acacia pycnantha]
MPSSSTSTSAWTYDVFLSFRGEDNRNSFTSHLYHALSQKGIHAFIDYELQKGEDISDTLFQAIQRSRMAIIIFLKLMQLLNDPSDVRHQRGRYGDAMKQHEKELEREGDRVLRWRQALTAAANLAGFNSSAHRNEGEMIIKIVKDVLQKLDIGQLFVADHPVGIETRVHELTIECSFESFKGLSKNVVDYCGRLPLALEILGSCLHDRAIVEWSATLSKLRRIPNKDIHAKLKISYDGLDDYTEKEIFLDICCFFINKDRNYVTQILDGCRLHANEMGKEIVRESSPKDPEKRSRLWFHEDVLEVLTEHTGTNAIEGISLKMETTPHRECLVDSKAFKKMRKLRLLRLDYQPQRSLETAPVAGDVKDTQAQSFVLLE